MDKETIARDQFNCSAAAGYCDLASIREHCCKTCEAHDELLEECVDDPEPGSGASCENLQSQCSDIAVKELCCATCSVNSTGTNTSSTANNTSGNSSAAAHAPIVLLSR
ncbi:unnamed protein product [Prorocentrum cordatum]|uniref:ShKT domain-containing protein n=1 Tax=Prorocentrum cordatum TaxID=2364126 RepID=A0ABN9WRF5_9DINO|nr:unnamed protein product [Polarella glacialis]